MTQVRKLRDRIDLNLAKGTLKYAYPLSFGRGSITETKQP